MKREKNDQNMRDGWMPHEDDTYIGGMGDVYERTRNGLVEIALQTDSRHRNLGGIVHGGVVMSLMDRVIGINCRLAAKGHRMVTANLNISFIGAIQVGGFITLSCQMNRVGRRTIFGDGRAEVDGRLVATASGVFLKID